MSGRSLVAPPVPLRARHALVGAARRAGHRAATSRPRRSRPPASRRRRHRPRRGVRGRQPSTTPPAALGGRRFDIVYTGLGRAQLAARHPALGRRWSRSWSRPGGFLYLSEFHPISWVFARRRPDRRARLLPAPSRSSSTSPGTYADLDGARPCTTAPRSGSTRSATSVSAVIEAGLAVELLHEHDYTLLPRWPFLERARRACVAMPRRPAARLPLMYSPARRRAPYPREACPRATRSTPRRAASAPPWSASRSSRSRRRSRATRWTAGPSASTGARVRSVDARGKHLFIRFEGDLTLHSHLRMTGPVGRLPARRALAPLAARRAWLVIRTDRARGGASSTGRCWS